MLKSDRWQHKKGRGSAVEGKRGSPPLHVGLAEALWILANIVDPDQMPQNLASDQDLHGLHL